MLSYITGATQLEVFMKQDAIDVDFRRKFK